MPIILNGTTGITTPGITNTGTFTFQGVVELPAGTASAPSLTTTGDTNTGIYFPAADQVAITTGGTQRVLVDASGNLGIGTTTLAERLRVKASNTTGSGIYGYFNCTNEIDSDFYVYITGSAATDKRASIGSTVNSALAFQTNATERARIDSVGNFGLGVTPSAWISTVKALQISSATTLAAGGQGQPVLIFNAFVNSAGDFKYLTNNFASRYEQLSGQHQWFTAPSGTAGNTITFTQAMTLDASGNLILGLTAAGGTATSAPNYITLGSYYSNTVGTATKAKLRLFEAGSVVYGFGISSNLLENHVPSNASVAWFINDSERMRLNTSGYLTTPNQPMFGAEHNATEGPNAGDAFLNWTVNVNTVTAAWNASTGEYTVPVAGRYFVACSLLRNTGSGSGGVYLQQNGTNVIRLFYCDSGSADSGYAMGSGQTIVDCAINDKLRVTQETSGVGWYGDGTGLGNFTIYLIG